MKKRILSVIIIVCMAAGISSYAAKCPGQEKVSNTKYSVSRDINFHTETSKSDDTDAKEGFDREEIWEDAWEYVNRPGNIQPYAAAGPGRGDGYITEGGWSGYINEDNETVKLSDYLGVGTVLMVPDALQGKTVTEISSGTFSSLKSDIESVTIPENIMYISAGAFTDCKSLTDIYVSEDNQAYTSENGILYDKEKTKLIRCPEGKQGEIDNLPGSLTSIGDNAFYNCEYVTNIRLPDHVKGIGAYTFLGCGMESIRLPDSLEYIKESAFKFCENLEYIEIPENVASIGADAFYGNYLKAFNVSEDNQTYTSEDGLLYDKGKTKLIVCPGKKDMGELFNLPESLKHIGDDAFRYCQSLTKIKLPEGLAGIGDRAFRYCENLKSIELPEGVVSIGNEAFYCAGLESVEFSKGLRHLGSYAFCACPISDVSLPEGLEVIGHDAFRSCSELVSIELPEKLKNFGVDVFGGCTKLENIFISSDSTEFSSENGVLYNKEKTELVCCPPGKWKGDKVSGLPDALTSIGERAFYQCEITEIELPKGLKSIGESAFHGCDRLREIELPEGFESMDTWAFASCSSLSRIILPGSLKSVGQYAFEYDGNLWEAYYLNDNKAWNQVLVGHGNEDFESVLLCYKEKKYE